ncbi:putative redox protein [Paenibacillus cellulosilyticus]|uniref:Putative redox protein n=1 Tax=Paenibacillus cellulosilyticus TaxID=375489 RepID=A0A2V2YVL1_9BACL|nr:OsmC family protein [Paenibacillus cellulosilyticus]PWW03255.1 putative redox protein [Paenibacillus cellulosilyticus]QKS43737.1 OsmC family protein [Paenibacillus cellulosilyticus]
MKVMTTWNGKRLFTSVGDSGYPVQMDATPAYGGDGKGATPMELVLAGLAGCIGIDVTMILNQFLDSIQQIDIEADGARKEETPTSFTGIELIFRIVGDIPDYRVWKAIDMGSKKYCAVSDSLKADISYRLVLNGVEIPHP